MTENNHIRATAAASKSGAGDYRFGFNGQMKDNELRGIGNSYDFVERGYSSRDVRFSTRDPLYRKFPWQSPYSFAGGNPIWNIDRDGLKKETYNIIVNEKTGAVDVRVATSNDLYGITRKISSTAFGISTHDYTNVRDWHDYKQVNVTHINKDGKVTMDSRNIVGAKRTTTNFDWGSGYANAKLGLSELFTPTKEAGSFSGLILTDTRGGSDNALNPNAAPGSKFVDAGAILGLMGRMKNFATKGPANVLEAVGYLNDALQMATGNEDAIKPGRIDLGSSNTGSIHCKHCRGNFEGKDGKISRTPTDKPATDTANTH